MSKRRRRFLIYRLDKQGLKVKRLYAIGETEKSFIFPEKVFKNGALVDSKSKNKSRYKSSSRFFFSRSIEEVSAEARRIISDRIKALKNQIEDYKELNYQFCNANNTTFRELDFL